MKVVAIEGQDGSGKTTLIERLKQKLPKDKFVFLKEPGSTKAGEEIRQVILNNNLNSQSEVLLFYSARVENIVQNILKAKSEGKNVILDRFELSTYAYQVYGNEQKSLKKLLDFLSESTGSFEIVDKYYFLNLDVKEAERRKSQRQEDGGEENRFDKKKRDFFTRVQKGYLEEIKKYNHKIIDAEKSVDEVFEDFYKDFMNFLEN